MPGVRVISDGTTVKVLIQQSATEPGSWTEGSHKVYESANFNLAGGLIGLAGGAEAMLADDLTVKTDRDDNGSFETTEHWDGFTVDGSGYAAETPVYAPIPFIPFIHVNFPRDAPNSLDFAHNRNIMVPAAALPWEMPRVRRRQGEHACVAMKEAERQVSQASRRVRSRSRRIA